MSLLTTLFALATTIEPAATIDAASPVAGDDAPEVIRLKVGAEVVGVIEPDGFDEAKGVRVRRVDDGALLDIGFDQMLPEDARRIRGSRGYLSDEPEPVLVDAVKVKLMGGEEFLGIIVEQGAESFKLRQGTKVWPINRAGVREIVPVRVDALEVCDPEELYAEELARRNPQTALDHYNLALFCESLQLWPRVKEQLGEVQQLDGQFKADIVQGKAKRAELRMELTEDSATLSKAQRLAQREQYDGALGVIDDFVAKKPGSPMKSEFDKQRKLIERQRGKWIRNQFVLNFFIFIERTARQIGSDAKSCKEARKEIELEGSKRALEATANALKVKVDEVRALWEDEKRQTASPHYASYGSGTWTLGDIESVMKGLVKEDPDKEANAAKAGKPAGDQSLEDKINDLLEKKRKEAEAAARDAKNPNNKKKQAARGPEIADIPPTEDEWWTATGADERTKYLLAWWADREPHVKIIKIQGDPCGVCTGLGFIRYYDRGGEDKWVPCSRCKGAQIDRTIRFH